MHRSRILRRPAGLAGALTLALLLTACGGGGGEDAPFTIVPPAGGTPPSGGTPNTPPPQPPAPPVWEPGAYLHGRSPVFGAFPSDLVRFGDTLFTNDADQITSVGADIVPLDVSAAVPVDSTRFARTTITAGDLVDDLGNAADVNTPIGFGFYLNDILVADTRLAFVLVNAGGSDSLPTLSNVVAFDPSTGTVLETFDLANPYTEAALLRDSGGSGIPGNRFTQSGSEALAYVPTSPTHGRLFVAMSNLVFGAPSFGAIKYPGTIQVIEVDRTGGKLFRSLPEGPLVTRAWRTRYHNPVALDVIQPDGGGQARLLVTEGGTTAFDANFNLVPVTDAGVEAFDASGAALGHFQLGRAGLVGRGALGRDGVGQRVGFFPSGVNGEVYLLWLDGLYRATVDPAALAILRGTANGIVVTGRAGLPGGNVTGVALSPDGRTLAVSGFGDLFAFPNPLPGRLFLLNLPTDLRTGAAFGTDFIPGRSEFGSVAGRTLGRVVLVPSAGARPDVFVNVSGPLDANGVGAGPASLGTLDTHGLIR